MSPARSTGAGSPAGRDAVRHIVGRDPTSLDAHGVARAAIESLAENFSDGVVAPVFWYLLLGCPGLFAYKMANTLDSMIGHKTPRYRAFGWAAARFDDLAQPGAGADQRAADRGRGAVLPQTAGRAGRWRSCCATARKHRSPNAGWPEAAMAGALGLALAGPRHYAEGVVVDPWVGDGTARAATVATSPARCGLYRLACLIAGRPGAGRLARRAISACSS